MRFSERYSDLILQKISDCDKEINSDVGKGLLLVKMDFKLKNNIDPTIIFKETVNANFSANPQWVEYLVLSPGKFFNLINA